MPTKIGSIVAGQEAFQPPSGFVTLKLPFEKLLPLGFEPLAPLCFLASSRLLRRQLLASTSALRPEAIGNQ